MKNLTSKFCKYQALGNDYIVLDHKNFDIELNKERVKRICHRNLGIGSDGILVGPKFLENGVPYMTIYNPDGSEAEKSGNGIRIFAKYLFDHNYITQSSFKIGTKGGIVAVKINNPNATNLTVVMGKLKFGGRKNVEIDGTEYACNIAFVGNPHCVVFLDKISEQLTRKIGPSLERHKFFHNRTNAQFVKVIDKNNIQIEIWERGAGYTLASGSGSAAAAGVCYNLGLCMKNVKVHMPGGNIEVSIKSNFEVTITGDVFSVAEGKFTTEFIKQLLELDS